jgi:tryptophan synthase alpha chain
MTYYNPIFVYGIERFVRRCVECGVDGLIVPDLPFEERDELLEVCSPQGIELISLIAPTSRERIERIAQASSGFLYCVSSLGVTGTRSELDGSAEAMISLAREVSSIPCAVGFGVSTPEQARDISRFADGVIVGSALVKIIAKHGRECSEPLQAFAREIAEAIRPDTEIVEAIQPDAEIAEAIRPNAAQTRPHTITYDQIHTTDTAATYKDARDDSPNSPKEDHHV